MKKMKAVPAQLPKPDADDNINTGNNNDDDDDDDQEETVKSEAEVEEEEGEEETETPQSVQEHLNLSQPPSTPSPSLLGKRTRKPKVILDDEISPFIKVKRNLKKKKNLPAVTPSSPSSSKSKHMSAVLAKKAASCKKEKGKADGLNSPAQVKSPALVRAEEVQLSLGTETPSFVKSVVRSHVSSCCWMGLPVPFCRSYLPRKDTTATLEDESGELFEIKYIAEKTGLSAGWRKFVAAQKLVEGDVLIFQLVGPFKFKVYIVRANDLNEVDGALSLLNLDVHTKQDDTDKIERQTDDADKCTTSPKDKKRKRLKSLSLTLMRKKNKKACLPRSAPPSGQLVEQSGNDSEEGGSEVLGGSKFSNHAIRFKDVKNFDDFHILVNGACIDSELSEHVRTKYYELCCSRNAFLHERMLPSVCRMLVGGIIFETVNIAEAMKACKLTTPREDFSMWEKSLKSFEILGMNVGFLRARLRRLQSLAFETEDASDAKRYLEAKAGQTRAEDEIRNLEAKLVALKDVSEKFGADIETLKVKAEIYELKFQEEVDAPW